ncbi:hypothetical protein JCM10213_007400 [Rhodosporidiobolus nylandii]
MKLFDAQQPAGGLQEILLLSLEESAKRQKVVVDQCLSSLAEECPNNIATLRDGKPLRRKLHRDCVFSPLAPGNGSKAACPEHWVLDYVNYLQGIDAATVLERRLIPGNRKGIVGLREKYGLPCRCPFNCPRRAMHDTSLAQA